jgi:hypothetical protein
MKVTIGQIVNSVGAFQKLANADLSLRTAHQLNRLIAELEKELAFFESEREKIINRNHISVIAGRTAGTEEGINEAEREFSELLNMEVELEAEQLEISISEEARLSSKDVGVLTPFLIFME